MAKVLLGQVTITSSSTMLLDWVNEWDKGKTQIGAEFVVTPKIFAGVKHEDGLLTGVALGHFPLTMCNDTATGLVVRDIDGIAGFDHGRTIFSVESSGNVQIGFADQSIRYNAATGQIEFGAGVSIHWIGATYIDSNGLFTGTLSAQTISAVNINASQITAGSISADRIDVASLKSQLINAANIEALTLNVTQGKIGGWSINSDAIYRGTKKNAVASFTDNLYDMTIGSMGIRGRKWRLDSIGSGAVAGGNIWWDIAGKVHFEESVSVQWQRGIDTAGELARAMAFGRMLYRDPTFSEGLNGVMLYDNTNGGHVTLTRQSDSTSPNDSKYIARIVNTGEAAPECGGFAWRTPSDVSKVFIVRLIARIPVQRQIAFATNDIGTDGTHRWLTPQQGTGQWQEYICKVICGETGVFSATNLFFVTGDFGTPSIPLVWDLCYATVFDITSAEKYTTTIDANGIYTGSLTAGQITTGILSADRIAAGSIKAEKLDAASIKSSIINTEYINGLSCTFVRGKIGGWTIGHDTIIAGAGGATPIQIRSAASGTGYWYNGSYRPLGISMLWHQNANAGHIVMGQVAATAQTVKTGFIGLQMMSYDGQEYFCLSTNYTRSESKEVYNRIAGWSFDNQRIWKNGISLGADGSITNNTSWKLNNDGSGQIANGNIKWSATGTVTFSTLVSLSWSEGINNIKDALGGTSYTKLTHIDSAGIYTGTLTAAQVNAVSINAGSITTGTLSADRLAAGSIRAEKLDAASIKASIINTDYINGLSCTFSRGRIGGWTIGASTITGGHIVLDSANNRIAVFDSLSSQTSGRRVQLYYNDDSNFGFYVTDAAGNCVARLGSVNLIASWNINTNRIYKNSVSLGADGSIQNSSKWQFNNDGSGRVASGNIAWDAAGNVTFGPSVALNWTHSSEQGRIYVRGTGLNNNAAGLVRINGKDAVVSYGRGFMLTVLNRSNLEVVSSVHYDVYESDLVCNNLAAAMNALTSDKIVILTSFDAIRINGTLLTAIERCGGSDWSGMGRYPYAFIGIPNIGKNNGLSAIWDIQATEPYAELSTIVINGIPQGISSAGRKLTSITAYGVYTGTISAGQINVDTALVVGGGSYNGSISVRDASNSVKVTLDRSGITAVGGTIGGWSLTASQIYSGPVVLSSGGTISNSNKWRLNADGSGGLAGGNLTWDTAGNLMATGGHFKDVTIQGTIRSAFVLNDPSIWIGGSDSSQVDPRHYDNVVVVRGSWNQNINLQWTLDQSGRRICLLNYMWKGTVSVGYMDISAPSGKWFYEDGIQKRTITFSRELIELLGYGDDQTFYGWIVINRRDVMCDGKYGQLQKVLAQGTVTCNSTSSASIKYRTFDGGTMSVSKSGTGNFYVYMPWSLGADKYMVMLTGKTCAVQNTAIYASVRNQYSSYFQVSTQDDASTNDGSFNFQVVSTYDFI